MKTFDIFRLSCTVLFLSVPCVAQNAAPDIWVGSFSDGGTLTVGELNNITNQPGYDSQPHFAPDGTLLYTSVRGERQPDIFRFNPRTGITEQITTTDDGEYSPTTMPSGETFSVIRGTEQWLWHFAMDASDRGAVIDGPRPVGYHAWGDNHTVAMFILSDSATGRPVTLQVADILTDQVDVVAERIGRSLHPIPNAHAISYVDKNSAPWRIMSLNLDDMSKSRIVETRPENEDYAWTPSGSILMGQGSELYVWQEGPGWRLVADLEEYGVTNISRLAVSSDSRQIAVVGIPASD
jgi:Tol biopolymer transport system component